MESEKPSGQKPQSDSFAPQRAIIAENTRVRETQERELLHHRLWAVSLVMAIGFGLILLRRVVIGSTGEPAFPLQVLSFTLLIVNVIGLSGRWHPGASRLRLLELFTFVAIAACLVADQYLHLSQYVLNPEAKYEELRVMFKASIIATLLLIFAYGIFIPNGWKRAACVIIPLAMLPLVAPAILGFSSPEFYALSQESLRFRKLSENLLYLMVGAITAIFGSHTISSMRLLASRERRLNQYVLSEKLGSGGMGEVYLAEHQRLKRPCAIKLIRKELTEKPNVLARFELEVRATAKLSHWNTIEVYDYGRAADGTLFYVMEYLPGMSLQQLVEKHGPMPAGRVIHLLRQACDGLSEAHEAGLIHRDIKPPNIFASYRGGHYDVAKLLDFGLVKPVSDPESPAITREGMVTGSPLYMAPEQILKDHYADRRTDVYAMGGVAYFLLTGTPPFQGSDPMNVMIAHARDPVVPPSEQAVNIPRDLEQVVLRCLEKDPDQRYQTAEALGEALAGCDDAGRWSFAIAKGWWREREPGLKGGNTEESPSRAVVDPSPSEFTVPEGAPTLEAHEIGEFVEPLPDGWTGRPAAADGESANPKES